MEDFFIANRSQRRRDLSCQYCCIAVEQILAIDLVEMVVEVLFALDRRATMAYLEGVEVLTLDRIVERSNISIELRFHGVHRTSISGAKPDSP